MVISLAVVAFLVMLAFADPAFAAGSNTNSNASDAVGFSAMTQMLQTMVTVLLLPIGILIAGGRIIYYALFVGIMGIDPFGWAEGKNDNVGELIKSSFWGFAKGLAWVAGVWVILQLCLTVVNMLAAALDANF